MSILKNMSEGGVKGIFAGIGTLAKDIRSAITGKTVLTNEDMVKLEQLTHEMELSVLNADKEIALAQAEINKQEAVSDKLFKSGWRPAVGWVCVLGLFYQFILRTMLPWVMVMCGYDAPEMPTLDLGTLMPLLFGILGLGGFRTFEKVKGVNK